MHARLQRIDSNPRPHFCSPPSSLESCAVCPKPSNHITSAVLTGFKRGSGSSSKASGADWMHWTEDAINVFQGRATRGSFFTQPWIVEHIGCQLDCRGFGSGWKVMVPGLCCKGGKHLLDHHLLPATKAIPQRFPTSVLQDHLRGATSSHAIFQCAYGYVRLAR